MQVFCYFSPLSYGTLIIWDADLSSIESGEEGQTAFSRLFPFVHKTLHLLEMALQEPVQTIWQGEDVVAGIRTPLPISAMKETLPGKCCHLPPKWR
jgi:hypothetical protein